MKRILDWVKKIEICEVMHGHKGKYGMCPHCGLPMDMLNASINNPELYYITVFYRALKGKYISSINYSIDETDREYTLKEWADAGKYLIDNILPKYRFKKSKNGQWARENIVSAAAILGYVDPSLPKNQRELIQACARIQFVATADMFPRIGNKETLASKKYDREQIDALFDSDINRWEVTKRDNDRTYKYTITDKDYFFTRLNELYAQDRISEFAIICNIMINRSTFKEIDSKYFPFLSSQEILITSETSPSLLAIYKNDILNNVGYLPLSMASSSSLGELTWRLSRTKAVDGPRPEKIKLRGLL